MSKSKHGINAHRIRREYETIRPRANGTPKRTSTIEQTHSIVIRAYCREGTDDFTHAIIDDGMRSFFLNGEEADDLIDYLASIVQESTEHLDNNVHGFSDPEIYGGD